MWGVIKDQNEERGKEYWAKKRKLKANDLSLAGKSLPEISCGYCQKKEIKKKK